MPIWKFIESETIEQFSFLQSEFNFPDFNAHQIRDDYYINTKKGDIEFSVYVQMEGDWCPIISIFHTEESDEIDTDQTPTSRYYVDELEKDNDVITSIGRIGEENIKQFIRECAEILKRNSEILHGDTGKFTKSVETGPSEIELEETPGARTLLESVIDKWRKIFRNSGQNR